MRIVVTGMGVISSLGYSVSDFYQGLKAGKVGIHQIQQIPEIEQLKTQFASEVPNYQSAEFFNKSELALYDRYTQFQLLSTREAVTHSKLTFADNSAERAVVILGTGIGGQSTQEANYKRIYAENAKRLTPLTVPKLIPSSAVSNVSIELGITGPSYAISSACASATHAIIQSCLLLQAGIADVAVTGGSEACITYGTVKAWEALRVTSNKFCRPFSLDRDGMNLGEGAGTLVLETLEHAQARGADIYAEVLGFGMSSDASHPVQPNFDGPTRAMKTALANAGIGQTEVQYINAHGTGTKQNDSMETKAIREVFGKHADSLAVSSTKSMHGHTLGAAGALESIATICAIREQLIPPTMNFSEPDPECDLDYVPNESRAGTIDIAVSNSFAFGGLNASVVFKKFSY